MTACSSSSSSPGSTSVDGGSVVTSDGGISSADRAVCDAIPTADVQSLVSHALDTTKVGDHTGDTVPCLFYCSNGYYLDVALYRSDADKSVYSTNSGGGRATTSLSGVGDEAYWNEPTPGKSVPQLSAHQGNATCILQPSPLDPTDTTLRTTPDSSGSGYSVNDSDALAYVQLMGKVCNDLFAAAR